MFNDDECFYSARSLCNYVFYNHVYNICLFYMNQQGCRPFGQECKWFVESFGRWKRPLPGRCTRGRYGHQQRKLIQDAEKMISQINDFFGFGAVDSVKLRFCFCCDICCCFFLLVYSIRQFRMLKFFISGFRRWSDYSTNTAPRSRNSAWNQCLLRPLLRKWVWVRTLWNRLMISAHPWLCLRTLKLVAMILLKILLKATMMMRMGWRLIPAHQLLKKSKEVPQHLFLRYLFHFFKTIQPGLIVSSWYHFHFIPFDNININNL